MIGGCGLMCYFSYLNELVGEFIECLIWYCCVLVFWLLVCC